MENVSIWKRPVEQGAWSWLLIGRRLKDGFASGHLQCRELQGLGLVVCRKRTLSRRLPALPCTLTLHFQPGAAGSLLSARALTRFGSAAVAPDNLCST